MDLDELNKKSYNQIAKQFSFSRVYVWPDVLVFQEFVRENGKLLDLGCGNGRLIGLFENKKIEYLGVDFSEELLACAKNNFPDKKFLAMDALNLDLPEKSFDVVLCVSVLNHLPQDKHVQFVENIKKVLKSGGYLLMSNWNLWNARSKKSVWTLNFRKLLRGGFKDVQTKWKSGEQVAELYYYAFTKNEIGRLLAKNGFMVEKNYYSKRGKRSGWLFGENIVTVAKLK